MLKLSRSRLRCYVLLDLFDMYHISYSLSLCNFDDLQPILLDPSYALLDYLNQPLKAHIHRNPHIHHQVDPDDPNDQPTCLIPHFYTCIKEPSEHEAWIGHRQDAHLVEDLLKVCDSVYEGLVIQEVPEKGQRLEEKQVHLQKAPVC